MIDGIMRKAEMTETTIFILQLSTRPSHLAITGVSRYRFIDLKITVLHRCYLRIKSTRAATIYPYRSSV